MNSSILKMAEFLLSYANFGKEIKAVNGKKAFLERNAPKDLLKTLFEMKNFTISVSK